MITTHDRRETPLLLASRWLAPLAMCFFACAHVPAPPFPDVPAAGTFPYELLAPIEPEEPMVQGIYLSEGKRGEPPRITIARFRRVNGEKEGALKFDMKAITKLQSQLEGSSTVHDYVMKISNSNLGIAPDVVLSGIYKYEEDIATVDYDDLRESPFVCPLQDKMFFDGHTFNAPSLGDDSDCDMRKLKVAAVPPTPAASQQGAQRVAFREYNTDKELYDEKGDDKYLGYLNSQIASTNKFYEDFRKDLVTAPAAVDDFVKRKKHAYALCDPTGKLVAAWDGRNFWRDPWVRVLVFTPSTNPLYPAPKYYSMWEVANSYQPSESDGETLKNAFQILYLVSQQAARTGR